MNRKLTDQNKIDIVSEYLETRISLRALGRKYKVSHQAIIGVLTRREIKIVKK